MRAAQCVCVALAVFVVTSANANAAPTTCPQHFAGGAAPDVHIPALQTRTYDTCHLSYAAQASGLTKTGIWSLSTSHAIAFGPREALRGSTTSVRTPPYPHGIEPS